MKLFYAIVAAGLAASPMAAQAKDVPDSAPARAITIMPAENGVRRAFPSPEIVSMKECREGIMDMLNGRTKDDAGAIWICVPTDMTALDNSTYFPIVNYEPK